MKTRKAAENVIVVKQSRIERSLTEFDVYEFGIHK